jgi:hypothetical protein
MLGATVGLRLAPNANCTVPVIGNVPEKVLAPPRISVPPPANDRLPVAPLSAITPLYVTVCPVGMFSTPVPLRPMPRLAFSVVVPVMASVAPPESWMLLVVGAPGAAPRLPSPAALSVPAVMFVPPEYVFAPLSTSVPVPVLLSVPADVPLAMTPPSV